MKFPTSIESRRSSSLERRSILVSALFNVPGSGASRNQ